MPATSAKAEEMVRAKSAEGTDPHFLVYWFVEGGWMGYDMFNPVTTPNNLVDRLQNISEERYRVLKFGEPGYGIYRHGNIRYGYLAEPGKDL